VSEKFYELRAYCHKEMYDFDTIRFERLLSFNSSFSNALLNWSIWKRHWMIEFLTLLMSTCSKCFRYYSVLEWLLFLILQFIFLWLGFTWSGSSVSFFYLCQKIMFDRFSSLSLLQLVVEWESFDFSSVGACLSL